MKTFQQFQEGLVSSGLKALGKTKLIDIVKFGAGAFAVKKGAEYLGKKEGESEIKKPKLKKSDPIKDLIPNINKRNKALEDAINKS